MNQKRDKTHKEQIESWAEFVKNNDRKKWKLQLNRFIDAQIIMARKFYKKLEKTAAGKKKITELRNLKFKKG